MRRLIDICNAVKHIGNILNQLTIYSGRLVIVVEGVKDKAWLTKLGFSDEDIIVYNFSGFDNNIIEYRGRGFTHILLLVDFDKEGRKLEERIRNMVMEHGYKELRGVRVVFSKYTHFFGYTIESYIKNYLLFSDTCKRKGLL